jgi:hypothetical protein
MYRELGSVKGVVDLSPQLALDEAEAFLGVTRRGQVIFTVAPGASGFKLQVGDTNMLSDKNGYVDLSFWWSLNKTWDRENSGLGNNLGAVGVVKLVRWGAVAGVIGGSSFVTNGLVGFLSSDTFLMWFGSNSFLDLSALYEQAQGLDFPVKAVAVGVGLFLMLCLLGALHARQSSASGILGKIGLFASLAGGVLLLFGVLMAGLSSAYLAGWIPVFSWEWYVALLAFMVGLPVASLGLVISVIATVRARVLPGWARHSFAALLAGALLAFVVDFVLGIVDDAVENGYIAGDRSLESYAEISRTLGMLGDVLGLMEGVLFGLAWVVVGIALLTRGKRGPAAP